MDGGSGLWKNASGFTLSFNKSIFLKKKLQKLATKARFTQTLDPTPEVSSLLPIRLLI